MQFKNDIKDLNQDCKLSKSAGNILIPDDICSSNYNVFKVQNDESVSKFSPFRNLFSSSKINNIEKQPSELPIESLSQETRNFLRELAASSNTKTSSESGYALSAINSPLSSKSKNIQIVADSVENKTVSECIGVSTSNNDSVSIPIDSSVITMETAENLSFLNNEEDMSATSSKDINISGAENVSVLNDQDVSVLDHADVHIEENMSVPDDLLNITENTDVVSALDLIEQSSQHDREMSSAEICNSLNQIFSEANVVFSANTDSNIEPSQALETGNDYETITLQTVDTGVENFSNVETNTINLADLCSADNSELSQQIVLLQDESGNIETVLLLPQNAQFIENVSSYEDGTEESMPFLVDCESINKETEIQKEQRIFVDNGPTDKLLHEIQNVSIMHDTLDNAKSILTLDSINDQQHKADLEDCIITQVLSAPKNLVTGHDNLEMKETTKEINVPAKKFVNQYKGILIDQKNNSVNMSSSHKNSVSIIEDDVQIMMVDKDTVLAQKQLCGNIQNKQEFQIKGSENAITNAIEMQSTVRNTVKLSFEEVSTAVDSKISLLKPSLDDTDNSYKFLNEHEKKSSSNVNSNFVNTLISSENRDEFSINSVANIPDSNLLTNVHFSSKAKKQFSINGTRLNSVQFDPYILPSLSDAPSKKTRGTSISTPLNGSVYHSQSNSAVVQNHQCYNDSSNVRQFIQSEILRKGVQKSKKTITHKLNNRAAKKTVSSSKKSDDLSLIYQLLNNSDPKSFDELIKNDENYIKVKKLLLKRGVEDEVIDYVLKRKKSSHLKSIFDNVVPELNNESELKSHTVALKTFIKPFTAAKKSAFDLRRKAKNTALKTCMSIGFMKNTALKSFSQKQISENSKQLASKDDFSQSCFEKNTSSTKNQQNSHGLSKTYFQPQVCEIRILPNEYVKRASDVLLKKNSTGRKSERPCSPEENVSEEEIKLSPECSSPFNKLMIPKIHCICSEKEIPCLCYDNDLRKICEAEDTFDDKVVPCTNHVSQHYLHTPSSEIKHRAFCDIHLWRLRQHHCCPKCGIFCSQGEFLLCSFENLEKRENHLFHTSCFIIPSSGLPPSCPHCCQFSNFMPVTLICKSALDKEQKEVPSNAQNITSDIDGYDVYLILKEVAPEQSLDSDTYVPQKNMTQLMIRSLAKENSFRLRPTAKCLYNPIKTGDVQKVMQLIGNGVNPNHKFKMHGNNAPVHVAAHYGWTGILHILIQSGAYIDSVNDDLETPLIVAVERKQLPIVRYLILAGAQIDVKDCNGMTSFHIASKNGFKEIAEFLYSTGNIDINLQDDGGWTALVWACEHKHVEFVRWLLEIGADPNVRDSEGNTVLHWAAYSGKCEIAELLLDKGCTLSYVNKRGDSALHIAAREDNYECIKLFINRGAVVDQKNKENKTPLMCCEDDSLSFNYLCQSISSGMLKIGKLQLEKHVVFRDISRGAEAYPIQAINEVDDEEFIMEFRYVVKQCHRSGVNIKSTVDSMQFCYCKDNCVTRDCNCILNSKCWYDANGCLTSEYDIQSSPVIFECSKTCHCPKTCINRVVQQGLRFPLQIFRTRYKGWGVRALQDIPKGAFVCEYVGELITGTEATQRSDDTYLFDLESQGSDYCLDGRYFGNVARFLNHSCEPNLIALKVFVDHQDLNFPRIAFFAYKEIQAFEELCFDYGLDFWIVKCQTILCVCNTQSCKYSKDTIDDTLWRFFMDTDNGEQMNCVS